VAKNRYKVEVAAAVALARHNQTETLPAVTITATATKKTPFPSSSSVVLFAQMMFADQVHRTRLRSFFTELFCEAHF
jgi:hypothetical protein